MANTFAAPGKPNKKKPAATLKNVLVMGLTAKK